MDDHHGDDSNAAADSPDLTALRKKPKDET